MEKYKNKYYYRYLKAKLASYYLRLNLAYLKPKLEDLVYGRCPPHLGPCI